MWGRPQHGDVHRTRRLIGYIGGTALLTAAVITLVVALAAQRSAPQPSASARGRIDVTSPVKGEPSAPSMPSATSPDPGPGSTSPATPAPPPPLTASAPTYVDIPAIDVHSSLTQVGKNPDGTLAVPQPGPNLNKVAWYRGSPSPGQDGPSVLEGHVDTIAGPSVFYRLGALQPGNRIVVTRADHTVVTFTVNAVRAYTTHEDFPAAQVFGGDLVHPSLRLITCSNFDESIGHYIGNTVVFAHLTSIQRH
jgi:sortase (surface protein transpeptidase)